MGLEKSCSPTYKNWDSTVCSIDLVACQESRHRLFFLGKPVRLSARRLREQYLPTSTDQSGSFYIRVTVDGNLVGNAFACRWTCKGKTVCWITQLVVDQYHRGKGLASGLLRTLKQDHDDIYGVMSSHPAACLAAAKAFGSKFHTQVFWRDTYLE